MTLSGGTYNPFQNRAKPIPMMKLTTPLDAQKNFHADLNADRGEKVALVL